MTQYTTINVSEDNFIYRIVRVERLFELFQERVNVLTAPSLWDDPFENFILKSPVRMKSGAMGQLSDRDKVFGQCWTQNKASDAMWRIYSPNKTAVRVRTTVRKLVLTLSASTKIKILAKKQCFIGKVEYLSSEKLMRFAKRVFVDFATDNAAARTLLIKRTAFKHEKEVRLLYFEAISGTVHPQGLYRYDINPHDLIDQIMGDPRLSVKDAKSLILKIRNETGFQGNILRSLLYAPPDKFVIEMPY